MEGEDLLVARVKMAANNYPAKAGSAPFFLAFVVSSYQFTREKEPTTSPDQPTIFFSPDHLGVR
jgi:hypothetical protein